MTTPQKFIESFLQEKADAYVETNDRLRAVHTKYFGEPLLKHASDFLTRGTAQAQFENVQHSGDSALVITREPVARKRYHLSAVDGAWKIIRIDRECIHCGGTGKSGRMSCEMCAGEGWHDPRA
jgi:hypothetical protein